MKRTLYWVNTRELDRELCTELSTLYTSHQKVVLEIDFNGGLWMHVSDFIY